MQGWGQIFNQGVLLLLLIIFNNGRTDPPYTPRTAQLVYRISFGLIAVVSEKSAKHFVRSNTSLLLVTSLATIF